MTQAKHTVVSSLLLDIEKAFEGLTPPSDDEILHPDCIDDVDIQEFYGPVLREDLIRENIVYSYAALGAFSPGAFQYYLPVFLTSFLSHQDSTDYVDESLLIALDPGTEQEMDHAFRKSRFEALTPGQVDAVVKFLWHVSGDKDLGGLADQALEHYWLQAGHDRA